MPACPAFAEAPSRSISDPLHFGQPEIPSLSLTGISAKGWWLGALRDAFPAVRQEGRVQVQKRTPDLVDSMVMSKPDKK